MCAFRMAHEGTEYCQATDRVPLPLNTTAGEAAELLKHMNLNSSTSDLINRMNLNATYELDWQTYMPPLTSSSRSIVAAIFRDKMR